MICELPHLKSRGALEDENRRLKRKLRRAQVAAEELIALRERVRAKAAKWREWVASTTGKPFSSDDVCETVTDLASELDALLQENG